MCYDIKASKEAQLKRAQRHGDAAAVEQIKQELIPFTDLPLHHASGFQHPKLLIYTETSKWKPEVATWGLVPHWVKHRDQAKKYWNNTLNARGETLFEKPAFRDAARSHRCLVYVDGFYEHHHFKGKTYPFFIHRQDGEPVILAGLWNRWSDPENEDQLNTFSIVTTEGNPLLSKIHNNPKLEGPRMPLILPEEMTDAWLAEVNDKLDQEQLETLIQPFPDELLTAHTVSRLRGKEYRGNVEGISEPFPYPELEEEAI